MLHCIPQVRGDLEQDPQVFESLYTLNSVIFKHKLLVLVSKTEKRFDFGNPNRNQNLMVIFLERPDLELGSWLCLGVGPEPKLRFFNFFWGGEIK